MRESDAPPPGDPSLRGSRWWALLIIAAVLVFVVWFAMKNWGPADPGRGGTVPVVPPSGSRP